MDKEQADKSRDSLGTEKSATTAADRLVASGEVQPTADAATDKKNAEPHAKRSYSLARKIAVAAVATALLSGGKLALAALPNVEVVTLLCAVYGYSLGLTGLASVFAFVILEIFIWGFGTWVFTYLVHWPLVCVTFIVMRRLTKSKRVIPTLFAVLLTVFFSAFSSFVDVTLFIYYENFFFRFGIYFMRGIPFYITQIICNAVLFPLLFPVLTHITDLSYGKRPRR